MSDLQPSTHEPTAAIDAQAKEERRAELAKKAGRFRILIVGKANAGKTAILKKICNTTDDSDIYDSKGRKIDPSNIEPNAERGIHDIANEMIFRSSPGFIFHDSCGFEAGGVDELQKVKAFVTERSKEKKLANQVHVIWYCIPMNDSRPITNAEIQFFSRSGTGKVPVIAVFTKCEDLELQAIEVLQEEQQLSYLNAVKGAPEYARNHLWNTHLVLEKYKYPPQGHVYLQEMQKSNTNCKELIECTASVLESDTLQALFVSTQQVSLEISMKYATRGIYVHKKSKPEDRTIWVLEMFKKMMRYFPFYVLCISDDHLLNDHRLREHYLWSKFSDQENKAIALALLQLANLHVLDSIQNQVTQLCTAFAIIAEHVYLIWDQARLVSATSIPATIIQYQQSPQCNKVSSQVLEAIAEHLSSLSEFEGSPSRYIKGVLWKRKAKEQLKEAFLEKLSNIAFWQIG